MGMRYELEREDDEGNVTVYTLDVHYEDEPADHDVGFRGGVYLDVILHNGKGFPLTKREEDEVLAAVERHLDAVREDHETRYRE